MKCPVCNSSGLSENLNNCSHCNSDLEAFRITQKLDKTNKGRLTFGIIVSILFLLLVVWIASTMILGSKNETENSFTIIESDQLKIEMSSLKKENDQLKKDNRDLSAKLAQTPKETEKRQKTYVVKQGETLYSIARKIYGNGYKYEDLAKDNNISEPANLLEGQKLIIYY